MMAWYLGAWYQPADLQKSSSSTQPGVFVPNKVISSSAFTQGWVWRVAQTHPMGYSDWRFGYWSTKPPELSQFIGAA
jgi:hypothetical protein